MPNKGNSDGEQVLALIKELLALKQGQFQPVDADASIVARRGGHDEDPSQLGLIVEFSQRERCFIDQLQKLAVAERKLLELNILTSDEFSTFFTPLHQMMGTDLEFLLIVETDLLRPPQDRRWSHAFQEWSQIAETYGTLIGSEFRIKSLLRSKLVDKTPPKQDARREAIFECLALLPLPSLCFRSKVEFVQVRKVALLGRSWCWVTS